MKFIRLLLLICLPFSVHAESNSILDSIGPSISVRESYWNRDTSYSSDRNFIASFAWLTLRPEKVLDSKFFFEGYIGTNSTFQNAPTYAEVREAYLEHSWGNFDVRVGRQIVVWGRTDKINPTDQWTAKNLKLLFSDDEEQRLGSLALMTTFNLGTFRFISLYQPEWRPPVYPIPPVPGITFSNLEPSEKYAQYGFKMDQTGGSFDWSLSYSHVISKTPGLSVSSAGAAGVNLGLNYEPVKVFGGDLALTLGQFGLRAESAYTLTKDTDGSDPTLFNRELFTVLGVEHSPIENLNLNFQFLYKHVFDFKDLNSYGNASLNLLANQEALISNQLNENQFGLSFRPSFKSMNDTLEYEIAYVQWFGHVGGLVRPKLTYAFNDHLKGMIGAVGYFGSADSYFGRLKEISSVFTEMRANF
jgi:hypothetical protein